MEGEPLSQELSDQDRILLVFGYLGPLALVSLVASRREFVKWHAKQGLMLAAAVIALYVILSFVHFLTGFAWRWIERLFEAGALLTLLGVGIAAIVCIVRALEGERFKLPMLGELADRL